MKTSRRYPWLLLVLLAGGFCLAGCFRQDVVTVKLSVPGLGGEECEAIITNGLMAVEGMVAVRGNPEERKVQVTYDARLLAYKNIQHLIADLGFEADGRPPDPERQALLPEACRPRSVSAKRQGEP